MTEAQQFLAAAQPQDALHALEKEVRSRPAEASLRQALVHVLAILGDWDRMLKQLGVLAEMGVTEQVTARSLEQMVVCERHRLEVMAGRKTPMFFGEPPHWVSSLVAALEQLNTDQPLAALNLTQQAFEQAPARAGQAGETTFQWLADADMRFGPIFEIVIQGNYYWVPMDQIKRMDIPAPTSVGDLVWLPVNIELLDGSELPAMLFTRYPGSDSASEGALQMSRLTEWREATAGYYLGTGQRVFTTDQGDISLLDIRSIVWDAAEETAEPAAAEGGDHG